ncbi:hypothetical protein M3Y99_01916100 [Aphelenchoides fujianensis]|nr:hypothetical protein M3Y99_01916100 [Aphelenchoides fujianensis]
MAAFPDLQYRDLTLHFEVDNLLNRQEEAVAVACNPDFRLSASALGRAVEQAGGQPFADAVADLVENAQVYNPMVEVVPSTGNLRSQHTILVPLRRHFATRMVDVFAGIFERAIALNVPSLALPPIGTGGFRLDRAACGNAMTDALLAVQDFGQLNRIALIDSNRNSVQYFYDFLQQFILEDQQQNPQFYPNVTIPPPAQLPDDPADDQVDAAGPSAQPAAAPPAVPFSNFFDALTAERVAEMRAKRLEEIEAEKNDNKQQNLEVIEPCSVCLQEMCEEDLSAYTENDDMTIVQLNRCAHRFHRSCVVTWFRNAPKCPLCQQPYTAITGPQPPDGRMSWHQVSRGRLAGYPNVRGYIRINYDFPDGIQTAAHIRPDTPYSGTHRECFLPNTPEGLRVLQLLRIAFDRRLTFTVGDSQTSGRRNTVVWNGIHHKTRRTGGPQAYGYPDPGYLDRVKAELAAVGVTEADLDDGGRDSSDDSMDVDAIDDEDDV